jgi:ParB/RepB/Spo0J family partition protein
LVQSIKAVGLINPITVAKQGEDYKLIAGFRRLTAHKHLGRERIEAKIINDSEFLGVIVHLDENLKRERFTEIQEAEYLASILHRLQITYEQLGKVINKTPAFISQRISILKWNEKLRETLKNEELSYSVCRELNRVKDNEQLERFLYHATTSGVNWKTVKRWVDDYIDLSRAEKEQLVMPTAEEADGNEAEEMATPFIERWQQRADERTATATATLTDGDADGLFFPPAEEAGLDAPQMVKCDVCEEFYAGHNVNEMVICVTCIEDLEYRVKVAEYAEKLGLINQINEAIQAEIFLYPQD